MRSARTVHAVAGAAVLLALAGCGSSSGGDSPATPTGSPATATGSAAHDAGPVCVGTAPAGGVHVSLGGGFELPGGGVQYTGASADGTTRTATLRDGAAYADGQQTRTAESGAQVSFGGHAYAVREICSYRVVLEPLDASVRTALAAAPASLKSKGSAADDKLCFSTNSSVRAAVSAGFPPKGSDWTLPVNGGLHVLPTGLSVAATSVDTGAGTAVLGASCAGIAVASYKDAAAGDTVEFGGVTFKVTAVRQTAVTLTRTG
jgi:hypothetical protein